MKTVHVNTIDARKRVLALLCVSLMLPVSQASAKKSDAKYIREIRRLEKNIQDLQVAKNQADRQIRQLKDNPAPSAVNQPQSKGSASSAETSGVDKEVVQREEQTFDLLSKIDAFSEKDDRLRLDSAKAHYNMGNIYYYKGEYEIASREYFQAVVLMPDDPDSHYNLAYVSGEHLNDFQTALKHYKMYLYLNPKARDVALVKEKIIEAKLTLRSYVNSPLENKDTE